MSKASSHKKFYDNLYSDPFQKFTANPKHAFSQVNGETEANQQKLILQSQASKRF